MVSTQTNDIYEKLKGVENYGTWHIGMKMRLIKKDLWQVIEDEDIDLNNHNIRKKDKRAIAEICLAVVPQLYKIVDSCHSALEVWQKLSELYELKGMQRRINLKTEFNALKYENFKSMADFIDKINDIQKDLENMDATQH